MTQHRGITTVGLCFCAQPQGSKNDPKDVQSDRRIPSIIKGTKAANFILVVIFS